MSTRKLDDITLLKEKRIKIVYKHLTKVMLAYMRQFIYDFASLRLKQASSEFNDCNKRLPINLRHVDRDDNGDTHIFHLRAEKVALGNFLSQLSHDCKLLHDTYLDSKHGRDGGLDGELILYVEDPILQCLHYMSGHERITSENKSTLDLLFDACHDLDRLMHVSS